MNETWKKIMSVPATAQNAVWLLVLKIVSGLTEKREHLAGFVNHATALECEIGGDGTLSGQRPERRDNTRLVENYLPLLLCEKRSTIECANESYGYASKFIPATAASVSVLNAQNPIHVFSQWITSTTMATWKEIVALALDVAGRGTIFTASLFAKVSRKLFSYCVLTAIWAKQETVGSVLT